MSEIKQDHVQPCGEVGSSKEGLRLSREVQDVIRRNVRSRSPLKLRDREHEMVEWGPAKDDESSGESV
jgi:hypothetical protein